ncbi:MAG: hypothetical protein MJY80_07360 [Bacteroidales bacterium]|nr:hypothetical protein [Bacteroidales bacterium]
MKKTLSLLSLAVLTIGLLGSCSKINERIDGLDKRLNNLENDKIASVEQQIAAINQSIADLGTIRTNIQTLMDAKEAQGEDITKLKEADQALEGKINDLKAYVDTELAKYATTDWANATFATLEKQAEIITDVTKLKQDLAGLDAALDQDIEDLDSSLKAWVNEQLSAYSTTAQMEAKIKALQDQIDALKADNETNKSDIEDLEADLAQLEQDLESAKATIKTAYEKAIKDALESNNGYITEKIKRAISSANGSISSLSSRVGTLETQVEALRGDVDALKGMIQSVTIIPAYSDGSVEADENGELTINCIIRPASAVTGLSKDNFTVLLNEVNTKAGAYITLNANSFKTIDADAGEVEITADISAYTTLDNGKALTAAVKVEKGVSKFTTKFVGITCGVTVVQTVPSSAATFTLADNKKVRLIIEPRTTNLTLQYDGNSHYPEKLEVRIKDGREINAELSGNLPFTHVDFTSGHIDHTSLTTSSSTLEVVTPATIGTLEVKGGNVIIKGATVQTIEVAADAVADPETKAPVQIVVEKYTPEPTEEDPNPEEKKPVVTEGIKANANVIVAPAATVEVKVTTTGTAQVANEGQGTVEDSSGEPIMTKAAAQIGEATYITLKDALYIVPANNDQTVTINILEDIVLKASEALTINKNNVILDGQSHTITLDETDTNLDKYKEDGDNKKYGSFQMIKVTGNDAVLRNLTLDSKGYRGVSLATTWGGKNATYQNIVYKGKGSGHYYGYAASEGTLTFTGCTFNTCGYAIHTAESTTDLVVTNCNIDGWVSYGDKTKSATFTNCKFYKAEDKHNGTLATVRPYCSTAFTACSFSSDYLTDSRYTGITVRSNVVVSLKNCTVDGSENLYELANITNPDDSWVAGGVLAINAEGDATTGFTAGTFVAKQASDIKVKSGYRADAVEGKGNVYTVSVIPPVAKVGDTEYATLQEAFDAARAAMGGTITLVADVVLAKTINWNGADSSKEAKGDGTVTDCSNKYTFDLNGYHVTPKEGTSCYIQVKGCEFNIKDSQGGGCISNPKGFAFYLGSEREPHYNNCGVLNISGGTFKGKNDDPCSAFGHVYSIGTDGTTNDNHVNAKIINIYGGEFEGLSCDEVKVNIYGGHFTSYIYKGKRNDTDEYLDGKENDAIFVYGGKFDITGWKTQTLEPYKFDMVEITNDLLHIYAGDFNLDPTAYVMEGSKVEKVGDRWIVTQNN